jgi:Fuc2NAc and GlcNAc transferase
MSLVVLRLSGELRGPLAWALAGGGFAMAVVGFIDDRWTLPARVRFPVHLAAAAAAALLIGVPRDILGGFIGQAGWLVWAVIVIAMVWATNLFNFMDGIDGIAALEAAFFASAAAGLNAHLAGDPGLTTAMLALAGASLGFLVWNWPPARIFMGDVGSGFLGFELAACALAMSGRTPVAVQVTLILAAVFVVDASVTLVRRMVRGDRWFEAHRMHAYQHLAQRFGSHRSVTLLVGLTDLAWLLPWAIAAAEYPEHAMLCVTLAYLPLVILALAAGAGTPRGD